MGSNPTLSAIIKPPPPDLLENALIGWGKKGRRAVGHVDHVSHGVVRGWAWIPSKPDRRVRLYFFRQGVFLGQTSTGLFRDDLFSNGFGDGRHGFLFHIPAGEGDDCHDIDVFTTDFATLSSVFGSGAKAPISHGEILGPLVAREAASTTRLASTTWNTSAQPPDRNMPSFVEHIVQKYSRSDLRGAADVAKWYLGFYSREQGPRRAPLAVADLTYLRQIEPNGRPRAANLLGAISGSEKKRALDSVYRWAVEESRMVFVEDCLVSSSDVSILRSVEAGRSEPFPLSAFMVELRRRTAFLERLPTADARSRIQLYVLIMLLALRDPHYLMFFPTDWLRETLEDDQNESLLTRTVADLFGRDVVLPAARYRDLINARGFDLSTQSFLGREEGDGRFPLRRSMASEFEFDVQLIGPLSRMMGLGESCRRVHAALKSTGYSVNAVDFRIGSSTDGLGLDDASSGLKRARVNILHLNAEEIPEALAYLDDVFSGAKNIAIPYWELDRISAVHRLGISLIDELWVCSRFLATVFEGCGKPVRWIGMSHSSSEPMVDVPADFRRANAIPSDAFVFLTTSDARSWAQRKNPAGVVEAFKAAFPLDANVFLVVKTRNSSDVSSDAQKTIWRQVSSWAADDPRILLIDRALDGADYHALGAASDALVSLHRAEGLGLDLIDAAHAGLSLVATAYSGVMDFCTRETAWLVDYDLVPVGSSDYCFVEPGQMWADPRLDSAVSAFRDIVARPDERDAKRRRGIRMIDDNFSSRALSDRLACELRRLLGR